MYYVKLYVRAIVVMLVIAIVALFGVGILTYLFKWQADKVMIGIIVAYILSGVAGGVCLRKEEQKGCRKRLIESLKIATAYIFLLSIFSCFIFQIPFEFSRRFLLIWLLMVSSTFVGMCLKR